jgi:membrane protease YdiL (CAAX protease family)
MDLLAIATLAGVGEEMLFRGVFQGVLSRWAGVGVGLTLASALFGVLHAITFTYAVLAALAGAFLGALWLWTGNLLTPIIVHTLYDFLLLVYLLYFHQPPDPAPSPE